MSDSWMHNPQIDKTIKAARETIEEMGAQFKRNVDMRMKRGDVRTAILLLLHERPMHGYQIIHEIEERSGGVWKPSAGSVYPTLQLLADEGLVKSEESCGRRTYSLTTAGEEVAEGEAESRAPWDADFASANSPRSQLASAGLKLAKTAARAARLDTDEQLEQARKILEDATDALHRLIKQD